MRGKYSKHCSAPLCILSIWQKNWLWGDFKWQSSNQWPFFIDSLHLTTINIFRKGRDEASFSAVREQKDDHTSAVREQKDDNSSAARKQKDDHASAAREQKDDHASAARKQKDDSSSAVREQKEDDDDLEEGEYRSSDSE